MERKWYVRGLNGVVGLKEVRRDDEEWWKMEVWRDDEEWWNGTVEGHNPQSPLIMASRSSSTVVMDLIPYVSWRNLATFGERNEGRVGPRRMPLIPR